MAEVHVHLKIIRGVCRVFPHHVSVRKNDTVTWHAHDDKMKITLFEPAALFGWVMDPDPAAGKSGPHTVPDKPGVYEYAVHCSPGGFAEGESHPIIIVDY